jgi:hypothetical protein
MRRSSGPTAKVLWFASQRPGGVITWSEAKGSYACGTVLGYGGPRMAAAHHRMSISNVLRRHFIPVEGARGLYVLKSSVDNPDWDEDMRAMQAFHDLYGSDEFGMSTRDTEDLLRSLERHAPPKPRRFQRMSEIDHSTGCDAELLEASDSGCACLATD